MNFVKISLVKFILGYVVLALVLYFVSLNLLIKDFIDIENEQNDNNIKTLLKKFDTELENLHATTGDYANWDDTNIFLNDVNDEYLYENFRDGTNTLESLDIDFIIFSKTDHSLVFSKYQNRFKIKKELFEKIIIEKFQNTKAKDTIINFNDKIIYLVKSEVFNSDHDGKSNGYLISGKLLTKESLEETNSIFSEIKISHKEEHNLQTFDFDSKLLPTVNKNTAYTANTITNSLCFHTDKDEFIFALEAKNDRTVYQKGLNTIYLLNISIDVILFILLFLIYKNQKIVQTYNETLNKKVEQKTKELKILNEHLENRVIEEVEKNTKKQIQLFEQSKMASLGSMVGNIVHQWRQPLTQIAMLASSIKVDVVINTLSPKKIEKDMNNIIDKVDYMNEVISTFRNFMMEKKEKKEVILQENIDKALDIVGLTLKDLHIKLLKNEDYEKEPIKIFLTTGELSEVIINILNNAKDILIEKDITNPWIKLDLKKDDDKVTISIEDNGGGVPKDILPNIFEESFTTKDTSVGTGLGLHMSHEIVTKSLNGDLYCKNTPNGAQFFIELPLNR